MGRAKLLLPLGGKSVIERLLDALRGAGVTERFVMVRPDDEPLREAAESCGATVVQPADPPSQMRVSVELALKAITERCAPSPGDGWVLVPADHPVLDAAVLGELIREWRRHTPRILVPTYQGRRGHPAFFSWDLVDDVLQIPPNRGLNWLLEQYADDVREHAVQSSAVVTDLDTPEDYQSLLEAWRADSE